MSRNRMQHLAKRARAAAAIAGLAALLAAGCGAARPSKYYQLTVPPDTGAAAAAPNALPVTLLVGRITAPELYRQDEIVYSSGGESMGMYEYHRWVEPPTEMISEILLRQLRGSGRFRSVNLVRSGVRGDFLLHGHLYDFRSINGTTARVTLELELRNIKTASVAWSHFYTHDEAVSSKDIDAIVAALDRNIQQGITESRASLDEYFTTHPPAQQAP